jgi:hypothetical protein
VLNAFSRALFLRASAARGAFYGTAVGCRNATAEAELREATLGHTASFGRARVAAVAVAARGVDAFRGAAEAAGREAGAGRRR